MDKQKAETSEAGSLENRILNLISDVNEVYSLSFALTEVFTSSEQDVSEFVPALNVLTERLRDFRDKIADLGIPQ